MSWPMPPLEGPQHERAPTSTRRNPMLRQPEDRALALQCLQLAAAPYGVAGTASEIVEVAERYFAFVTGDDAKERLDAVRAAVS